MFDAIFFSLFSCALFVFQCLCVMKVKVVFGFLPMSIFLVFALVVEPRREGTSQFFSPKISGLWPQTCTPGNVTSDGGSEAVW